MQCNKITITVLTKFTLYLNAWDLKTWDRKTCRCACTGNSLQCIYNGRCLDTVFTFIAESLVLVLTTLSPGHSQIFDFSPRLRDKIWEWPGDEATTDLSASV